MVYLNHAATSYPKPWEVQEAVKRAVADPPQSQYRGTVADRRDIMQLCRRNLAQLFHVKEPERFFFTSGATEALNLAILGAWKNRKSEGKGDRHRIVITATEHNAVLRTIFDGLQGERGAGELKVSIVPCDKSGYVDLKYMKEAITDDTFMVIVNHSSNVTGAVQEAEEIGGWVKEKGALYLVDASQSAGMRPVDVDALQADLLAFTAHKGLYGIEGSGGLFIREGLALRPILFGGNGINSKIMVPDSPFYEVGTANIPGIAGLNAGVEYVQRIGIHNIVQKEKALMEKLYRGLKELPGVNIYADRQPEGTALSYNMEGLNPLDLGYILSGTYGIQVRTGFHCAPFIHEYLGTQREGTVRVSISYMTQDMDVEALLEAMKKLTTEMS